MLYDAGRTPRDDEQARLGPTKLLEHIEPELLPIGDTSTESSNLAEKARLDVSAVGIWSQMERTFLDVRVFHPNSASYMNTEPQQLYIQHEREKKRMYNDRILQVEKGSFSPLIFERI